MGCSGYSYDDADEYEYAEVWRESSPRARKHHRCCECGDYIWPGERYERADAIGSGRADHYCRCLDCAALAEVVAAERKSCPLWGGLREACDELDPDPWWPWQDAKVERRRRGIGVARLAAAERGARGEGS